MTKSRNILAPRKVWTALELAQFDARYPNESTCALAATFGVSNSVIYTTAKRRGIKKSEAYLSSPLSGRLDGVRGASTRFAKGDRAWNDGVKGLDFGGAATRFKPGHLPHNHTPIGTIRPTSRDLYLKVKVAEPNVWEFLHRRTWEAANGAIPAGHAIIFKDKNRNNCDLANLELVTCAELSKRNARWHAYPTELKQVIRLNNKLSKEIKNARKQKNSR